MDNTVDPDERTMNRRLTVEYDPGLGGWAAKLHHGDDMVLSVYVSEDAVSAGDEALTAAAVADAFADVVSHDPDWEGW